jgi:hypothetical protein
VDVADVEDSYDGIMRFGETAPVSPDPVRIS